jgi:large subunit ribosomal protein L24
LKLRANDNVLVIKGRDRGKQARIQQTFPKGNKVLVEGVNVVLRHTKPSPNVRQAGIIQKELPISAANVMLVCTHCGRPTRVGFQTLADGTKARICSNATCKEVIE